jgi:coenzyme F420-dependent oxidoreductase
MTRKTVHLPVAEQEGLDDFTTIAKRAEDLGYERAWIPETWGRDAVTILSAIANETEEIGIGTSIVNVYARSPALLAQTAVSLQELSDGRMRLGIGPSGPIVIEGWHGVDFDRPLRRTREAIDVIRMVMSGEELDYDGDVFNLSGFRLRSDPPEELPPVDAAGMGPKAVELCGRFADGWHATVFTAEGLEERMEDFHRGAELGDRDPDDLTATLSLNCCVLEDGERARDLARKHAAFYIGAMGTYYRDSLARQGYEEEANEVAAAYASGDRERAYEAIDDEMLDSMAVAGTPERAREEIQKFEAIDGLDSIAVGFPRGATMDDVESTLDALAPE